jgi:hypothetical protein
MNPAIDTDQTRSSPGDKGTEVAGACVSAMKATCVQNASVHTDILVLACGSRGDVQPLLLLAQALLKLQHRIVFITHREHEVTTSQLLTTYLECDNESSILITLWSDHNSSSGNILVDEYNLLHRSIESYPST